MKDISDNEKRAIIYINGEKLHEGYGGNTYTDAKLAKETIYLDDDDYFVLGDNREVSKDSREKEIGLLNENSIVGKAWISIYPFSEWGIIKQKRVNTDKLY